MMHFKDARALEKVSRHPVDKAMRLLFSLPLEMNNPVMLAFQPI